MRKTLILIACLLLITPSLQTYALGPYTQRAVDKIQTEADIAYMMGPQNPWEYYATVSCMQYVYANISGYIWKDINVRTGRTTYTVEEALELNAGLCGGQIQVYKGIMDEIGITSRTIQFYGEDSTNGKNHIMIEVFYSNKWHFVDVTPCAFFKAPGTTSYDMLSLDEVLQETDYSNAVINYSGLFYQQSGMPPYIYSTTMDIIIDGNGEVTLLNRNGSVSLKNVPNYCGTYFFEYTHDLSTLTYRIKAMESADSITFSVYAAGGTSGRMTLSAGGQSLSQDMTNGAASYMFDVSSLDMADGLEVEVEPTVGDIFYPVFSSITVQ
jgi:hypothetical protein